MSALKPQSKPDDFRDHLTTIDSDGKQRWIIPKMPKGKIYTIRKWVSYFYYLLFFATPFIKVNGRPLMLFDVTSSKFILFGYIFGPQDFFILGLVMLAGLLFIYFFTLAFGRVFCGWLCPQTFFMEMLFRRIDYWVLGDAPRQKLLQKKSWDGEKIRKYSIRYGLYFLISFLISNTFLAYIIGADALIQTIAEPPQQHWGELLSLLIFTCVFFGVFAFIREQVCTNICPYGRLQSVLLNKKSIVVAYDYGRGEPRGKFTKKADAGLGDCIDCFQCVQVCPTGIDIRNGTQLECINCTACIDACDSMMEAVKRPKGLIRYASEENIANGKKDVFNFRLKVYATLLGALVVVIALLIVTRKDMNGVILRTKGSLYQERGTDSLVNMYNIKFTNKTNKHQAVTLKLLNTEGHIEMPGITQIDVHPDDVTNMPFFIVLPKSVMQDTKKHLKVGVFKNGKQINTLQATFSGPIPGFQ